MSESWCEKCMSIFFLFLTLSYVVKNVALCKGFIEERSSENAAKTKKRLKHKKKSNKSHLMAVYITQVKLVQSQGSVKLQNIQPV